MNILLTSAKLHAKHVLSRVFKMKTFLAIYQNASINLLK